MATVRVLRPIQPEQPERLTKRPPELGAHWRLCPRCKGVGEARTRVDEAQTVTNKCERCAGKGMVCE